MSFLWLAIVKQGGGYQRLHVEYLLRVTGLFGPFFSVAIMYQCPEIEAFPPVEVAGFQASPEFRLRVGTFFGGKKFAECLPEFLDHGADLQVFDVQHFDSIERHVCVCEAKRRKQEKQDVEIFHRDGWMVKWLDG